MRRDGQAGDDMGLVERFDRKLESTVADAFARVFGGSILPEELERMLCREATDGVRTLQGGQLLAPNEYVITLAEPDYQKLIADPDLTSDTFAKHLAGFIADQGWQPYGDVVVSFEQSPALHTGQVRARGVVNPDAAPTEPEAANPTPSTDTPAPPQSQQALTAEPGVPAMSDNPTYRGGQGEDRPGDEYYDDRYGRPQDDPRGQDSRGQDPRGQDPRYGSNQGTYPQGDPNYPPRQGYPNQGGYPPQYDRPPYGPPAGGYDQGYRQPPPPGYGYGGPQGDYDYGRPTTPRPDDYGRQGYPDQGGYDQGYNAPPYGRQDYPQPDYGRYQGPPGYDPRGRDYGPDYGQPPSSGYSGYQQPGQGEYRPTGGPAVTLQLDDGSGRTYQLREGANVVGRGQDAQFRLPDTGVSRRHLEIRWDGQVALLSDLNSTNGTTVNNAPVQEWQLADGDVIRLGHSEIVVRVH
jgi:hypothetical protein